jgi:hypothetical protein
VPIFATLKVARDLHMELARGLYSVPAELGRAARRLGAGEDLLARAAGQNPLTGAARLTVDRPEGLSGRACGVGAAPCHRAWSLTPRVAGPEVRVYAARLLDTPLPWTRMRTVYRLLGLVRCYGASPSGKRALAR